MIYFISDIHLGAGYIADGHALERSVCRLLRDMKHDASHIYLLGDIIDYWFEYKDVVPRGFVRFLGTLADLSDSGVEITWLKGNHDLWMTDYLAGEIGCRIVDGILDVEISGQRIVMEHGDGVGEQPYAFRLLRRLFRSRSARRIFAAIHPRLTVGFAHRWSSHSRKAGGYSVPDSAPVVRWAKEYMRQHGHVDHFIIGHLHKAEQIDITPNSNLTVLGDSFRSYSYAKFDGKMIHLLKFDGPDTD